MVGRAIGRTVIDHDDLGGGRERVIEVLDRPLQFTSFVAADHDDADFIGHAPPATHCLSIRPWKTPGLLFPRIARSGIPECRNGAARIARNENGAQGMLPLKAFLSE